MALLPDVLRTAGADGAAAALRADPVLNHNFVISLIDTSSALAIVGSALMSAVADVALGGFSECSGLEMSMKTEDYNEGGNNGAVLKFPGRVSFGNLTLKKGQGTSSALWDWHYGFVVGKGKRRDGIVVLLTEQHLPNNIWYFRRGLPLKYSGPALNATQNSVAIESIEIAHEGLWQVPFVGAGSALASAAVGGISGGLNL
ncbi:phage tail protein [Variovorax sp. J22R24]|uniref:phage tail protein n=1 Tax=Variovorax gracilis TaxID=3053502 RepID=UPI00257682DD|nr:phage tail protein [Variovorax sp. J22R24]MDM0109623.1 phage tail protein [Variovorax sp. J22R24]